MQPHLSNLAIVIVLYETTLNMHKEKIEKFKNTGAKLYFIDNTPKSSNSIKKNIFSYISLKENTGIANALNHGINLALSEGYKYIITFDQDSELDQNLIIELLNHYQKLESEGNHFFALGPHPINKITGNSYLRRTDKIRLFFSKKENPIIPTREIITSGLLANRGTYKTVGLYRKDLFIDFVDHEWCWRLNKINGFCAVLKNTKLNHMVGDGDIPLTFGMKKGSSFRIYYLFRNATILIKTKKMPIFDAVKFIVLLPIKLAIFGIMKDRSERWKNSIKGILDGLKY